MPSQNRELTGREKQRLKKLITSLCANYDKEYGCLPLDCECPMFGICYTNSALCRYFRSAVLPTDAKLQAVFSSEPMPLTACGQCGKPFPADGKRMYCSQRCAEEARAGRPPHVYGNTGRRNNSRCNAFALGKPYGTRLFRGHFCTGRVVIPYVRFQPHKWLHHAGTNHIIQKFYEFFNRRCLWQTMKTTALLI